MYLPWLRALQGDDCKHLVIDSGALIANAKLDRFGPDVHYWTIREVVDEVRDENARRFLDTFPYKIQTTDVSDESLAAGMVLCDHGRVCNSVESDYVQLYMLRFLLLPQSPLSHARPEISPRSPAPIYASWRWRTVWRSRSMVQSTSALSPWAQWQRYCRCVIPCGPFGRNCLLLLAWP